MSAETSPGPRPRTDLPGPPTGFHPVHVGHLVMGVALSGIVVVWALIVGDVVDGHDVRWLVPLPWVVAGAVGLVASALTSGRHARRVTGWATAGEPSEPPEPDDGPQPT